MSNDLPDMPIQVFVETRDIVSQLRRLKGSYIVFVNKEGQLHCQEMYHCGKVLLLKPHRGE